MPKQQASIMKYVKSISQPNDITSEIARIAKKNEFLNDPCNGYFSFATTNDYVSVPTLRDRLQAAHFDLMCHYLLLQ